MIFQNYMFNIVQLFLKVFFLKSKRTTHCKTNPTTQPEKNTDRVLKAEWVLSLSEEGAVEKSGWLK